MKYEIPFFSLKRQWGTIKKNILPQLDALLESNQFVGGPYVTEFEKQFAQYTNSAHAIACNSGTDALWLALHALEIEPSSIVLTTPFSFIASSSEVIAHRAYPLFLDVDESYNICPKKIETWLKSNAIMLNNKAFYKKNNAPISGIITVDLFGQCANYPHIKAIADEWNLWIIEDACQAIGAHINNQNAGTLGDITCFSLYPTKNLGVCGDGGVMTTSNPYLAERLLVLRNHGRKSGYEYECYGLNSRLDAVQAMIATEKLHSLDVWNTRRREIAHIYTNRLKNIPTIKTPVEKTGYHVYHQYCIEVANRDQLKKHLEEKNIGTNIFYPKSLNQIPYLNQAEEYKTHCPIAEQLPKTILALPIWPELTDEEVNYICDCIEETQVSLTSTTHCSVSRSIQ
jgi:dTDP-4-amino-4,6-dideoxygalactose transaminase